VLLGEFHEQTLEHQDAHVLEVGDLLDWETAPLMFSFRDLDGNRFYVGQSS